MRGYGMLAVLLLLCVFFSFMTMTDQRLSGSEGAAALYARIRTEFPDGARVVIVSRASGDDSVFARVLQGRLAGAGYSIIASVSGDPIAIRSGLNAIVAESPGIDVLAASPQQATNLGPISSQIPALARVPLRTTPTERWPTFLLADNIRNVANQIAVIAIIAIGMTIVIIAGGIDLSVGSLIALSAVLAAWLIGAMGGVAASSGAMLAASLVAIALCGLIGVFSGFMITAFRIPPFIATLAIMQVAAGAAYIISEGMPIYQIPDSFVWIGRGAEPLLRVPIAVLLMLVLYALAHVMMTRTTFGRYVYAVGGNSEAARLAGIRVHLVLLAVYTICASLAGLGGVIMASQLKSGAPTYGVGYELHVIAAVVVGGASLSGGEGRIFGTLVGALVIGVIQNGMNLTNVESYTQKVVLGLVILGAVLLDQLKHRGFTRFLRRQLPQ